MNSFSQYSRFQVSGTKEGEREREIADLLMEDLAVGHDLYRREVAAVGIKTHGSKGANGYWPKKMGQVALHGIRDTSEMTTVYSVCCDILNLEKGRNGLS